MGTGGSGVAGSAGTAGAAGLEPRALIVDPATSRFVAYDRNGQIVHDYSAKLDLGSGYTARNIWVNGRLLPWDGPLDARPGGLLGRSPGLAEPPAPSWILIRAAPPAAGSAKVRMLTVGGQTAADLSVAGATWESFQLSPQGGYLYANAYVPARDVDLAAVVRLSDGMTLFRQEVGQSAFARDDSHFFYLPTNGLQPPVRVVDLATQTDIIPSLRQPVFMTQPGVTVTLVATTRDRAVIQTDGVNQFGRLLWSMDWAANITRFGSDMPTYNDEYLQTFDPSGGKATWSRQTNGLDGKPIVYAGAFEVDFASMAAGAWSGTDFACYGRPTDDLSYKLTAGGDAVQACACGSGTCTTIATLPAVSDAGWSPRLIVSANRKVVVVGYDWPLNRLPASFPQVTCLSATGQLLASLPAGTPMVDDTGQLVLLREPGLGISYRLGIANLATGAFTWLGTPVSAAIVYEWRAAIKAVSIAGRAPAARRSAVRRDGPRRRRERDRGRRHAAVVPGRAGLGHAVAGRERDQRAGDEPGLVRVGVGVPARAGGAAIAGRPAVARRRSWARRSAPR